MLDLSKSNARIVLLTHAPSDLAMLHSALKFLPADFPQCAGLNLQGVESETAQDSAPVIVNSLPKNLASVRSFERCAGVC